MKTCDTCGRNLAPGEPVACESAECPLVDDGTSLRGYDGAEDPTIIEPSASSDDLIARAMASVKDGEAPAGRNKAGRSAGKLSLEDLRAQLKKSSSKKRGHANVPAADEDSIPALELELEPVEDTPPPRSTADYSEDATVVDPEFDLGSVSIPLSIDTEAEGTDAPSDDFDLTVEAARPDLDEIRIAVAEAARDIGAQDSSEFESQDTQAGQPLAERRAPQPPRHPQKVARQQPFQQHAFAPADDTSEGLELKDVVDVDAWRDILVMATGLLACILVGYLAVGGWWKPSTVLFATFGVVIPTCAILGLLLLQSERRTEWMRIGARSAGLAGPFALIVTLGWASDDVRVWIFERAHDPANVVMLQTALEDPAQPVAERACRVLAGNQLQHGIVLAALDERPSLASYCMDHASSKEHRIAVNRIGDIWRSRLTTDDATAAACAYAEPYSHLPLDEDQKFYDFFDCAFAGDDDGLKKCCGDTIRQTYGQGADLIPGVQLITIDRLSAEALQTLIAPILHRKRLDAAGARNAAGLRLEDEELQRTAAEMACLLLEAPASAVAVEHLSAYAAAECSAKAGGATRRFDDWQQVCTDLARADTSVSTKDALCIALDTLDIARAVDEAWIRMQAAISRYKSRELEAGIEVGKARELQEELDSREQRLEEMVIDQINSRYDVHSKQRSLDALADLHAKRASHIEATKEDSQRRNSKKYREGVSRRKNILRLMMKTDNSWKDKIKQDGKSGR